MQTGSKNFRGGVAYLRCENKVVRQYPCSQLRNRCHFYLLDLYMAKLPVEAKEKNVFYLSPLQKLSKSWFSLVPLVRYILDRFVKDLCHEAEIEGKISHSLRATGTTHTSVFPLTKKGACAMFLVMLLISNHYSQ